MNLEDKVKNRWWVSEYLKSLLFRVNKLEKTAGPDGVQTVGGNTVDNTDPLNPIILGIESITGDLVDNSDPLNPVIIDAPSDGNFYARQDGAWEEVPTGGATYKIYRALLNQTGTNAPVAVVHENTFASALTWTYNDVGDYILTSVGNEFIQPKTTVTYNSARGNNVTAVNDGITFVYLNPKNSLGVIDNDQIYQDTIEIRVYP